MKEYKDVGIKIKTLWQVVLTQQHFRFMILLSLMITITTVKHKGAETYYIYNLLINLLFKVPRL